MAMKSYFKMTMVNIGIKTRSWVSSTIFWQGNERATFMQLCEMWILFSKSPVLLAMWIVVFGTWHCFDLWICGSEYLWLVLVGECNSWRQPQQPPFYLATIASSQLAATCGRPRQYFEFVHFFRIGIGQDKPRPTVNERLRPMKWFSFWEPNYLVSEIDESLNKLAKISISFILEW